MTRSTFLLTVLLGIVLHGTALPHDYGQQRVIEPLEGQQASAIRKSLLASSVIPDVLDDLSPTFTLLLTYPSTHTSVTLGNTLSVPSVQVQPVYEFPQILPSPPPGPVPPPNNHSYTLILTDPDARSRANPIWSEMCHWIVANVSSPENQLANNDNREYPVAGGRGDVSALRRNVLEPYLPPAPPKDSGLHRYVFVLLEGDDADSWKLAAPRKRKHWGYGKSRHGVRDWTQQYGLKVAGANFFYAENQKDDI